MKGGRFFQSDRAVAIAVFIAMLFLVPAVSTLSAWFTHDDWYLMDEGTILYASYRSSLGEIPHTELPYFYTGGLEILLGYVFQLFGGTFAVARWTLGLNMAATAALTYLISRNLTIDKAIAACFAVAATAIAFGMNFHVYPAWYSGTLLLLALLLLWHGLQTTAKHRWLILSGVCLGLASSMKQTSGLYALFAFVICILLVSGQVSLLPSPRRMQSSLRLNTMFSAFVATPLVMLTFFVILLRSQLTFLNAVMFLTAPLVIIALSVRSVVLAWRNSSTAEKFLANVQTSLVPLVVGVALGFLPLVLLYVSQGGVEQLIGDSFINIRQVFANRYSVFKFAEEEATSNPFVFIRWLTLFVLPIAAALIGFFHSMRSRHSEQSLLLLLNSALIAFLYFTLYPIAIRMYVLFLAPLVTISAAYFADKVLKKFFTSKAFRASVVVALFAFLVVMYLGSRSLGGDLHLIADTKAGLLDDHFGNALVSQGAIDYLKPVLQYIDRRPEEESFVGFDVFQKLIAFVTRRKIHTDYLQRHYFFEITHDDFAALKHLAEDKQIDIIVIGKRYLSHSPPESALFEYMNKNYSLALDSRTHLVYQRIPQ
ncbi:MAG: hypothetical protein HW412_349 [Bacteroidetes bacterium]|nr:hypothetical protein [Bacteroidota bacterium]